MTDAIEFCEQCQPLVFRHVEIDCEHQHLGFQIMKVSGSPAVAGDDVAYFFFYGFRNGFFRLLDLHRRYHGLPVAMLAFEMLHTITEPSFSPK